MASEPLPATRFDVGRVVERTFASIGRNFSVFLLLALLLAGAPAVLTGALLAAATGGAGAGPAADAGDSARYLALGGSAFGLVGIVSAIAAYILQAAIVYGAIADLNGRRAAFAECLSTGLRNWFWLFLLAIVVTVAEIFGFLLFIVPGLMMTVAWLVAVPVRVVERTGVFGAMGRSAQLTRGHRWPIFGLLVIFLIGTGVLQVAVSGVFGTLAASLSPGAGHVLTQVIAQPLLSLAANLVGATGIASIYYELRSTREGIGPEALAAVFD